MAKQNYVIVTYISYLGLS